MKWFHRKEAGLPTTGAPIRQDGSSRSIHMAPPIWRAWKNSNGFLKGTYICLFISIFLMISGYRQLRYHHASICLTCHAEECTLDINPPGRSKSVSLDFARRQLIQAQPIKVNDKGHFVKMGESNPYLHSYRQNKNRNKKDKKAYHGDPTRGGPDKEGNFDSYHLVLRPGKTPEEDEPDEGSKDDGDRPEDDDKVEESDFATVLSFTSTDEDGRLLVDMRKFNFAQTRRGTRTMINKIDAYIKKRRHKLVLKENSPLSVLGIFSLVTGLFLLLLTILLGEFVEESTAPKRRKTGGPGARRQQQQSPTTRNSSGGTSSSSNTNLKYRASAAGVPSRKTY